jgi:hypothetical protein
MHYYNAIQAAKYIGVDPKTVRRWLKKGLLTAERTEQGWLAIPGGQVEYAKIKWEEEQAKFARPWLPKASSGDMSNASLPTMSRETLDIIGRVETLEQKVAELEKALSNTSLVVPTLPIPPSTTSDIPAMSQPTIRNIDASSPLSADLLSARDFAAQLGIKYTVFEGMLRHGVRGEQIERTEIPSAREGYSSKYFNSEQQARAIELLRKHGKLS